MCLYETEEILGNGCWILDVARVLEGIVVTAFITAGITVGSTLWPNNFGEQVGKLVGVATIGGLLGPAIGGFAFELGQDMAFIVLAALTGLAIPIVALAWRDIDGGKGASREGAQAIERVPLRMFFDNPMLFRIGILVFLSTLATGALLDHQHPEAPPPGQRGPALGAHHVGRDCPRRIFCRATEFDP
mgnify:CR=1 FL=1